jgi:hypothetical protein
MKMYFIQPGINRQNWAHFDLRSCLLLTRLSPLFGKWQAYITSGQSEILRPAPPRFWQDRFGKLARQHACPVFRICPWHAPTTVPWIWRLSKKSSTTNSVTPILILPPLICKQFVGSHAQWLQLISKLVKEKWPNQKRNERNPPRNPRNPPTTTKTAAEMQCCCIAKFVPISTMAKTYNKWKRFINVLTCPSVVACATTIYGFVCIVL